MATVQASFQYFEYLVGVVFGFHHLRSDYAGHGSVRLDDKSSAECAHIFPPAHRFLAIYSELLHKFMVSVGYQRKRQLILFDELAVRRFGIDADTDHLHTGIPECAVVVAQIAGLRRTSRSGILGIEIQCDFLSGIIAPSNHPAVLVGSEDIGALSPSFIIFPVDYVQTTKITICGVFRAIGIRLFLYLCILNNGTSGRI